MSSESSLRAVVLGTVDYGEADRVVSLFSEERGKLSTFARGARASRRRFGGALEPFTALVAQIKERGGGLPVLEGVVVERAFGAIRGDLPRIACAGYACELVRELVRDGEPHPDLFELLLGYLGHLDAVPAEPTGLRAFELGALRSAGLAPRLDACARCGAPDPEPFPRPEVRGLKPAEVRGPGPEAFFDPAQGGLLCRGCALPHQGHPSSARPASREALQALLAVQRDGWQAGPLQSEVAGEARDLMTCFLEYQMGKRLKSRRFIEEVL
jgi:DNA repair protein RecO (recombination protein O)